MSDIFREVEEDLRRDRAVRLWKKYGPFVIGFAVAIVVGTAAYQGWRAWDHERRLERSERFAAALRLARDERREDALAALADLGGPDGSYGTLAAFERAELLAEAGRRDEALEIWRRLAGNAEAGPAFQGAARLFYVMHQIDEGDPAELRAMLAPLLEAGSGFRPLAQELTAILALREGDRARAREIFGEIADDPTAPTGVRSRAAQMTAALGAES